MGALMFYGGIAGMLISGALLLFFPWFYKKQRKDLMKKIEETR